MARKRKRAPNAEDTSVDTGSAIPDFQKAPGLVKEDNAQEEPPAKRSQQRRSLFVRSLAPSTTTETLIDHFSASFPVRHGTAVVDRSTQQCKGFGFVTFADADDAQRALAELQESELLGKKIRLELAEPRHRDVDDTLPDELRPHRGRAPNQTAAALKARREEERKAQTASKIIVRNLPWSIKDPDDLRQLFQDFGKIKLAVIPKKERGLLSGFGFVVVRGRKNAARAINEMNGKEVDGRILAVDWAVDKEVWEENRQAQKLASPQSSAVRGGASQQNNIDAAEEDDNVQLDVSEDDVESSDFEDFDDQFDEDDESDAGTDEDTEKHGSDQMTQANDYAATLFVRNLPFTTTDDTLFTHFRTHFGALRYARIVMDSTTERPKGTGFVCFRNAEDADSCLRNAPKLHTQAKQSLQTSFAGEQAKKPANKAALANSVLQPEIADTSGKYTLDGRILDLTRAVPRPEADRLASQHASRNSHGAADGTSSGIAAAEAKDKRRLYLLAESNISPSSPVHSQLTPSEQTLRDASAQQRRKLLKSNPALHLSLTRLSVRNLPRSTTQADLKALARRALVGYAEETKAGTRPRLTPAERARGGDAMREAERARKRRGMGVVKQATIVQEDRRGSKVTGKAAASGGGTSRGYGFIEYVTHRAALMGLRWLNGHVVGGSGDGTAPGKRRLIVEFALDNAQVVRRRAERENKARDRGSGGETAVGKAKGPGGRKQESGNAKSQVSDADTGGNAVTSKKEQGIIGKKRAMRRRKQQK